MSEAQVGQSVGLHYKGTFEDGTEFDNSRKRGEVITVTLGTGQLIAGFDEAVVGMTVGEIKNISLTPTEGYGESNPDAIQSCPKTSFPNDFDFQQGIIVQGQDQNKQTVMATITEVHDEHITLDYNHPMAGKNLNFEIELIGIQASE